MNNPFQKLAESLWADGEDGERLAVQLAAALDWIVTEGTGKKRDDAEIVRLLQVARRDA